MRLRPHLLRTLVWRDVARLIRNGPALMLLGLMALRAHVLRRRVWLLFGLALVSVLHNAGWNLALIPVMGVEGIALATSLNLTLVPALFLWTLRHDLAGATSWQAWWPVLAIVAASSAVAGGIELLLGPAMSLLAPQVIVGALPCGLLLAVAFRTTRPQTVSTGESTGVLGP